MEDVVIGLCLTALAGCILYWEWRADWTRHITRRR
jgi:hypothetical protein